MKKLNRRGYMTVEIIIASVIAFSIAFFLMEITMKLVDVTDNEYADTNFMTDKALIITNVKKYVEDYLDDVKSDGDPRVNFTCSGNKCTAQSESNAYLGLYIQNNSIIVENNDGTLYSKEVDSRVKVNSLTGSNNGDYIYFQIKCTNIFSDEDYNINIVIYNGLGYDSWITKLSHDKKKINVAANVMHAKDGTYEHLWHNSKTMGKLADYLVKEYTKIDPENETYYKKNAAKYKQKLTKLQTLIAKIKKNSDNKKVAVSEPVFDYALKDMGYKISNSHFAKATEDGSDPSYSDIKKLQNDIKHKKIAFFVENTQSDSKVISGIVDLCKKYDVPVVKVTETSPKGKDYLQWMSSEYKQVLKIQDGK